MKFSEQNQQSKKIIKTTKSTLNIIDNAISTFSNRLNNSLEKADLISQKTNTIKDEIYTLEMKKLDDKLNNNKNTVEDINNKIKILKNQIKDIKRQSRL